jgi:prevent-host-death family protein
MDSWPQSLARQATENHPWQSSQERTGLTSPFNQSIYAFMKKVGITEAKNHLSALIDGLKNGSPVLIVDRGRPVARLEPATSANGADVDGRLSRLIREGIVRPSRNSGPRALFTDQPPRPKGGASVVAALIKERREGR